MYADMNSEIGHTSSEALLYRRYIVTVSVRILGLYVNGFFSLVKKYKYIRTQTSLNIIFRPF